MFLLFSSIHGKTTRLTNGYPRYPNYLRFLATAYNSNCELLTWEKVFYDCRLSELFPYEGDPLPELTLIMNDGAVIYPNGSALKGWFDE